MCLALGLLEDLAKPLTDVHHPQSRELKKNETGRGADASVCVLRP